LKESASVIACEQPFLTDSVLQPDPRLLDGVDLTIINGPPETRPVTEVTNPLEIGERLQERFALHVEDIRNKGDMLDRMRVLSRGTLGLRGGLPFAVLAPPIAMTSDR
jgi:hypothetical protein